MFRVITIPWRTPLFLATGYRRLATGIMKRFGGSRGLATATAGEVNDRCL
jgi:hypothetical protein